MFTKEQIDAFIGAEGRHHPGGLTREKAAQFMRQRESAVSIAAPKSNRPFIYDDAYGTPRWSDTNERCL